MPDEPARIINFPHRNRIVAALIEGLLVVEARKNSGSLITVRNAIDLNKKIFVIPGNLDEEKSIGSNSLINNGAKCITNVKDMLVEFLPKSFKVNKNNTIETNEKNLSVPKEYQEIYNILSHDPIHIDELSRKTDESLSKINYILTILEIDGFIEQLPNKYFKLK